MINPYTPYYGSPSGPSTPMWADRTEAFNIGKKWIDLGGTSKVKTEDHTSKIENDIAEIKTLLKGLRSNDFELMQQTYSKNRGGNL